MDVLRKTCLVLIGLTLLTLLPVAGAEALRSDSPSGSGLALPASDWWLVIHNQCEDTLHWINPSGEFASIPRPPLPGEVAGSPCSYKPLHISQDGRYLAQTAPLSTGNMGMGFFDLQTGTWLQVHQTQPNELAYLGARYSSDSQNWIAIGFANESTAPRAWRVILFDMATGHAMVELRSDGPEIASFVGGEFLATAPVVPHVTLLSYDSATDDHRAYIRFDDFDGGVVGGIGWYPQGVPGVGQKLISSPYTYQDMDLLPNGHAIYAYEDSGYPLGEPVGMPPHAVQTNAIGLMLPVDFDPSPTPQFLFADGLSTVHGAHWGADGRMAWFKRTESGATTIYWHTLGTAMLNPLTHEAAQVLGVPTGFVYNTSDGVYFLDESSPTPTGPVFADPMMSGSAAFVWATAYENPPVALDTPTADAGGAIPLPTTVPPPVSGGPDLFVSEFSLTPGTPTEGQPVEVRIGVYNQGDAAVATSFHIEWWPGENYSAPACEWDLDSMAARGGRILTCTYTGYPSPYSSINTLVVVDSANTVSESNEANNSYSQAVVVSAGGAPPPSAGQPDLFVSEFSLNPATPVQGEPVQVRVGVYNQGDAAVATPFHIEWWPGENYSSPACEWDLDSMAAGGGRILTCTYTGYPSHYPSINTLVVVDSAGAVEESNEANNSYAQAVTVSSGAPPPPAGQPDLFVSEFSLNPATPVQGEPVQVRVGVYNQGTAAVSGTTFRIEWWPGENYSSPGCDWTLDSMSAGGGRILTCTYSGYPSHYPSINTLVVVDSAGAVDESNESNNSYREAITVSSGAPPPPAGQPDLYVSEFSLNPATPTKGQPVQVRVGVYNQGTAAVSGTTFRIEWWPGENYSSPACDWTLDSLAARGGRILTCTYAGYPSRYPSINTMVVVDSAGAVDESNESNNVYKEAVTVNPD